MDRSQGILRRSLVIAGAASAIAPSFGSAKPQSVLTKPIPSTGETLLLIGLGTWITFNVGRDIEARDSCTEVLRAFFAAGGRLIDSAAAPPLGTLSGVADGHPGLRVPPDPG